jgi:regulator of protease activity HflC (stomatin/prohibitin superfamily)
VIPEREFQAFYKLTDPQRQITAYIFDVVRSCVPKILLDDVFSAKEEIAQNVKAQLAKAMESFGFLIVGCLVTDITPDGKVTPRALHPSREERRRRAGEHRVSGDGRRRRGRARRCATR